MLIWINGPFGVGKTQVAHELKRKCPGSVIADPELLGFGIQRMYPPELRVDFQDTPWWMPTVADILIDVARRHPGDVIVPMTLHDEARHHHIFEAADSALRKPQFSTHIHTDRRALAQVVTELGSVLGRQLRYSPQELVQLPFRSAIVKVRHIR
ncbi:hypothetical protein [Salinibacterium sp.]|uniref:hypothetical protein n=1 Tax=Salinibacterium sp. TaxID=1915057 RepID=UPI00286AADC6|nr:hypothetical protein [Salinibacterium sp.]